MPKHTVILSADVWYQTLCFLTRIEIISYKLVGKFVRCVIEEYFGEDQPPFLPIDSIYVYSLHPYPKGKHFYQWRCCYESWIAPLVWWEIILPEIAHEKASSRHSSIKSMLSKDQPHNLFLKRKLVLSNRDSQGDYESLIRQNKTAPWKERFQVSETPKRNILSCFGKKSSKSRCDRSNLQHGPARQIDDQYLAFVEPLLAPRYVRVLKLVYVSDSLDLTWKYGSFEDKNDAWLQLFQNFPHAWLSPESAVDISVYIKMAPSLSPQVRLRHKQESYRQILGRMNIHRRTQLCDSVKEYAIQQSIFEKVLPWTQNCKRVSIGPTVTTALEEWWLLLPQQCLPSFPSCSSNCPSKWRCQCLLTTSIRLLPPVGETYIDKRPVLGFHMDDFFKWLYNGRGKSNISNITNGKICDPCYVIFSPYTVDNVIKKLRQDFLASTDHLHKSEYRIVISLKAFFGGEISQFEQTLAWLEAENPQLAGKDTVYGSAELENDYTRERLVIGLTSIADSICYDAINRNIVIDRQSM
ncbi:hypothetical protein Ddc_13198 [Ditylenchus destructor]|nr:hypothetical protein Ddc_13198 [Ditylenchus destructor]